MVATPTHTWAGVSHVATSGKAREVPLGRHALSAAHSALRLSRDDWPSGNFHGRRELSPPSSGRLRCVGRWLCVERWLCVGRALRNRERDANDGSTSRRTVDVDCSAVHVDNALGGRKSQSCAPALRRKKRIENAVAYVLGDT